MLGKCLDSMRLPFPTPAIIPLAPFSWYALITRHFYPPRGLPFPTPDTLIPLPLLPTEGEGEFVLLGDTPRPLAEEAKPPLHSPFQKLTCNQPLMGEGQDGGEIPLTSILSHKGRGGRSGLNSYFESHSWPDTQGMW